MSQENAEVIEELYRRFADEQGDDLSLFAEDVEWHTIEGGLWHTIEGGRTGDTVIRGVEALEAHWADLDEAWHVATSAERITDLGDDVLVLERATVTGRASGIRVETLLGFVYTVVEGRITRVRCYREYSEALEAAGLRK